MSRILKRSAGNRGVALLIVLGLLATLFIYAIATQMAVQSSLNQSRNMRRTLRQRAAIDHALALASTWKAPHTEKIQASGLPADSIEISLAPFNPDDPAIPWPKNSGMAPLPGDGLVKIQWLADPKAELLYLVNQEGRRRGAILLP